MEYKDLFKDGMLLAEMVSEDVGNLFNAIIKVYPMIVLSNLTKNTYFMIRDEGFLHNAASYNGVYDELIDDNIANIHQNYQQTFFDCFSRENLIREYKKGKTDVYAELYQKDRKGNYQWVSTHVIRIEDKSGDIVQICFNRPLDGIVTKHHAHF